ncbi:MAG: ABC transporter substrate-binding protein [Chloroflexi bacterium]|nr:ABC transporter substrate-binding protein [Chloroflexota bacterium]
MAEPRSRLKWGCAVVGLLLVIAAAAVLVTNRFDERTLSSFRPPAADPASPSAQAGCAAKIGVVQPETSEYLKGVATEIMGAYELARDEINAAGGVGGCPLQLIVEDDGGVAERSRSVTRLLIEQERVPVILSTLLSDGALAMSAEASKRGTPLLVPNSGSPLITGLGYEWVFRLPADQTADINSSLGFLATISTTLPVPTLAIIHEDSLTSVGLATSLAVGAASRGYSLVASEQIKAGSPDFGVNVARVKRTNPDVLFLASTSAADAIRIVRQIGESGWRPRLMVGLSGAFTTSQFASSGEQTENFLATAAWAPDVSWRDESGRTGQDLLRVFQERYQAPLSDTGVSAYVALKVAATALDRAMKRPGGDLRANVRQALRDLNVENSNIGPIRFDRRGQNQQKTLIVQLVGKEFVTVYPPGVGTRSAVVPPLATSGR